MARPLTINVPIYVQTVHIHADMRTLPESLHGAAKQCSGFASIHHSKKTGRSSVEVWVGESPDITEIYTMQILVHELVHTAMLILGNAGVDVSTDNDEALAYLTDFLVGKALAGWGKLVPPDKEE